VKKMWIILASFSVAFVLMSMGYGFWEKTLIIRGNIEVVKPGSPDSSVPSFTETEWQSNPLVFEPQQSAVIEEVY